MRTLSIIKFFHLDAPGRRWVAAAFLDRRGPVFHLIEKQEEFLIGRI